ncbi:MAG: PqiC family protein [Nevskia sp.]|nr:PqiC family protein [Nevskia sp.]
MTAATTVLRTGLAVALCGLAACAAAPPPRLMLLSNDTALPPPAADTQRPLLVVRTVALPEYLDRRAVIYRSGDAELQRFPDTIWAERLGMSVTRWMAQQLTADLPAYDVQAFSAMGNTAPALTLNLELESFEPSAVTASALHLRGSWHLSGSATAEGRIAADVPMSVLDPDGTVAAMRVALTQAAADIAARVQGLPPAGGH